MFVVVIVVSIVVAVVDTMRIILFSCVFRIPYMKYNLNVFEGGESNIIHIDI